MCPRSASTRTATDGHLLLAASPWTSLASPLTPPDPSHSLPVSLPSPGSLPSHHRTRRRRHSSFTTARATAPPLRCVQRHRRYGHDRYTKSRASGSPASSSWASSSTSAALDRRRLPAFFDASPAPQSTLRHRGEPLVISPLAPPPISSSAVLTTEAVSFHPPAMAQPRPQLLLPASEPSVVLSTLLGVRRAP